MNVEKIEQFKEDPRWVEFKEELDKVIAQYAAQLQTCGVDDFKMLQVKIWTVKMIQSYPETLIERQTPQTKK